MSNAPKVDFSFENNNVQESTPTLGVSFVFARTTKGKKNDPSDIISGITQFQRLFGEEIIPGQTVSQIEKALRGGSKLRICRVLGSGAAQGSVTGGITFTIGGKAVRIGFKTQGYGDPIDGKDTFKVKVLTQNYATYLQVISAATGAVLENIYLYKYKEQNGKPLMDASGLTKYNRLSQYLELYIVSDTTNENINTPSKLKTWLESSTNLITVATAATAAAGGGSPVTPVPTSEEETKETTSSTKSSTKAAAAAVTPLAATENSSVEFNGSTGSAGSEPTLADWQAAMDCLWDYVDCYNVWVSGINHHLSPTDVVKLHTSFVTKCDELQEYRYFMELPWWQANNTNYKTGGDITDEAKMCTMAADWIGTIGNSKWAALFGGGCKFYDNEGELQDSDCLGSIIGLADTVATTRGYWESFAGLQKGIIWDANGPVIPNYGSPSRYEQLNNLANNYINVITIQDTPSSGKRTCLWNCFTTQFLQDSFRFVSIVGLVLYIKKTLRPIYRKYLEEPNIWNTWKLIYAEVKPILDSLVAANAISEYTYLGDQDAQKYSDLNVNTEAEVRQGKYKVKLKIKDIVPMQDISINVVIDKAERTISITQED